MAKRKQQRIYTWTEYVSKQTLAEFLTGLVIDGRHSIVQVIVCPTERFSPSNGRTTTTLEAIVVTEVN